MTIDPNLNPPPLQFTQKEQEDYNTLKMGWLRQINEAVNRLDEASGAKAVLKDEMDKASGE